MASKVKVPKLNENTDEVTITGWFKKEGQPVSKGDKLVEMTTDKAAFEVESPSSGVILRILAPEKSVLPTGYVVALIGADGEAPPDVTAANARLLQGHSGKKKAEAPPAPAAARAVPAATPPAAVPADPGVVRATPAARRLAKEKGIDLARVKAENQAEVVTEEMVRRMMS